MLPIALAATLLAAVASGSMFSGSRPPRHAGDNPAVDRVYHAIKTADNASELPSPPAPHEILAVDIRRPPFSSPPPNNNLPVWEESLKVATTKALEPWLPLGNGNKQLHDALSVASLCLRRPALLSAYRDMVHQLMEGWWPWGQTVTQDGKKRWRVLGDICGWAGQGEAGSHHDGSEL